MVLLWLARLAATMSYLGIFRNFAIVSGSLQMNMENTRDALQVKRENRRQQQTFILLEKTEDTVR